MCASRPALAVSYSGILILISTYPCKGFFQLQFQFQAVFKLVPESLSMSMQQPAEKPHCTQIEPTFKRF